MAIATPTYWFYHGPFLIHLLGVGRHLLSLRYTCFCHIFKQLNNECQLRSPCCARCSGHTMCRCVWQTGKTWGFLMTGVFTEKYLLSKKNAFSVCVDDFDWISLDFGDFFRLDVKSIGFSLLSWGTLKWSNDAFFRGHMLYKCVNPRDYLKKISVHIGCEESDVSSTC